MRAERGGMGEKFRCACCAVHMVAVVANFPWSCTGWAISHLSIDRIEMLLHTFCRASNSSTIGSFSVLTGICYLRAATIESSLSSVCVCVCGLQHESTQNGWLTRVLQTSEVGIIPRWLPRVMSYFCGNAVTISHLL